MELDGVTSMIYIKQNKTEVKQILNSIIICIIYRNKARGLIILMANRTGSYSPATLYPSSLSDFHWGPLKYGWDLS